MTRYIEWTDSRGRQNILVTQPLDFGPREDPRHEFEEEVLRYLQGGPDGGPVEVHDFCYCRQREDHWFHAREPIKAARP